MTKLEVGKEYWVKQKYLEFVKDGNNRSLKFVDAEGLFHWYNEGLELVEAIPGREKVMVGRGMDVYITAAKNSGLTLRQALNDFKPDNSDVFARAWLDGYEIKEPLYWVRNEDGYSLLYRGYSGITPSSTPAANYQERNRESYTFTEKEIKEYDERYWAFAVPVEEDDE